MAYLAIARKWRPTQFEDLVGQGHVVQTLKNAIVLNRVSHAYLFSGARGIGKTSVARIFAKALRCPNAKDAVPCHTCPECVAIAESRSVDVVEIDGASNNGVEAVRGIRENVAYGASTGHYKIYIIDEVHMLSLSAFNALLKTLEEPPSHVIFIFATTEVQKIPLTILSRCQRFEFRRLATRQIVERVRQILDAEKVTIAENGLQLLATHADGSLRDALSLLDQVLSFHGEVRASGKTIDEKAVVQALGVSDTSQVTTFVELIAKKDVPALLTLVRELYLAGVDLKHFAERALEELRLLYLVVVQPEMTAEELDISAGQFARLKQTASGLSLPQCERMAQILAKSISQLGWSSLPRFVLEMAAVRMTKLDQLERLEAGAEVSVAEPAQADPVVAVPVASHAPPAASSAANQSSKAFLDAVMKKRPLLGALLSHAEFKIENNVVALLFPEGSFYERQAQDTKNRAEIEALLKLYFGPTTSLSLSSAAGNTIKSLEAEKQAEAAAIKKRALEHPTVMKMKEMGAEIVDIKVEV